MVVLVPLVWTLAATLASCEASGGDYQDRYDYRPDNIIQTTHGSVQGRTENIPVHNGGYVKVDVFQGIPFSKPPVGGLRFKPPVPADPWSGVLQATTPPNSCFQVLVDTAPFPNPTTPLSEDCLYLNIFRPRCNNRRPGLATMIFYYPGFFTYGSSTVELYNGRQLAASQCVIVVTVNYRMGAFGFMYLGNKESPGNMGLEDAALALRWIKNNVAYFDGDDNKITTFGNSAGAVIASVFLLSPRTRDLFNNAIIQSIISERLFHQTKESALDAALKFARRLNCFSDNTTAIADCLRKASAADLALQHLQLTATLQSLMVLITDGSFLTRDPSVSLLIGDFKHCDILTGTTGDEGSVDLQSISAEYSVRRPDPPGNLTDQEFGESLSIALSWIFKTNVIPEIITKVKDIYDLDRLRGQVQDPTLRVLIQILSDLEYVCPTRLQAAIIANASQNVYVYSFNHPRDNTTLAPWIGATHTSEISFVFGTTSSDLLDFSRRERILSGKIMRLWANFAKYGNPTPDSWDTPKWPTYSPPDPAKILVFTKTADITIGRTESTRCAYWNSLPENYYLNRATSKN